MAQWIDGDNPRLELIDYNRKFREELRGELEEEVARKSLGKFFMYNLGITVSQLTGFYLEPYQRITIKGWMQKNFSLCIASRSYSKSFLFSHFAYLYCLFNPDHHVIIVSATFRSSRRVLENIEIWANRKRKVLPNGDVLPGGELLLQTFARKMEKKPDQYRITFQNGSTITALPLGDADNLRGFRCNVLGTDETLLIPQNTIELVLKPFLAGSSDITQKQRIRRKEDERISAGRMKETERRKFKSTSKMINLSSASYKWEELYEMYKRYLAIISPDQIEGAPKRDEMEDGVSSYLVQQFSYKVIKEDLMEPAIVKEIKEKLIPENVIRREYGAEFIDESGGYFSAKEMHKCTIPMGSLPCIEVSGEKGYEYVLGIDPSISSSPTADHFAMCVLKIISREPDGRKVGLVVHQYACAGAELKHHIAYLYYLLKKFNIVYIAVDCTQGQASDFINICNESEYMKSRKMELNPIEAEFTNESFDETVKQVQRSYNNDSSVKRIVQKQYFSSPIIKAGNEHLRACFDQKLIYFASHARSVKDAMTRLAAQDVMNIHNEHPEFVNSDVEGVGGNIWEFVEQQDLLIELVKKECALIEVTASPLGNVTFDIPHFMTRNRKNENRMRKDSYSALWLATWGLKVYLASQALPQREMEDDMPAPRLM